MMADSPPTFSTYGSIAASTESLTDDVSAEVAAHYDGYGYEEANDDGAVPHMDHRGRPLHRDAVGLGENDKDDYTNDMVRLPNQTPGCAWICRTFCWSGESLELGHGACRPNQTYGATAILTPRIHAQNDSRKPSRFSTWTRVVALSAVGVAAFYGEL